MTPLSCFIFCDNIIGATKSTILESSPCPLATKFILISRILKGRTQFALSYCAAGGDPDRPLAPLPERLSAEAALAEAILDLADVACKNADELRQLIADHGTQAGAHLSFLRLKGDRLIMRSHNVLNRIKTAMSLLYLLAVDGCHLQMHASRNPSSLHAVNRPVTSEDG